MAKFEAHWPLGTKQRLAYDVLLWTGLRRSDAAGLGPKHIQDGVLTITTEKTNHTVTMPVMAPLAASIAATPRDSDAATFFARNDRDSFGHWFKTACIAAGVPGRAHGLRKALAVKLAESGASPLEIGAILGNDMGAFYARKASRGKLAAAAFARIGLPHLPERDS
ncbi:MAG TPA: tyrosine-type recombinase/integrase [Roseiarcus sp.]|jgi:integrase